MYKEFEKAKRVSDYFEDETIIAQDSAKHVFTAISTTKRSEGKEYTKFQVERSYGVGMRFSVASCKKQYRELSYELGKTEIEMLIRFLQQHVADCTDYNGQYVKEKLISI